MSACNVTRIFLRTAIVVGVAITSAGMCRDWHGILAAVSRGMGRGVRVS